MIIRGEAGIGKSALLAKASELARARGYRVLTTTAVHSETHLPFAGLHQLLFPVLGEIERLPLPQRQSVEAAFGMVEGSQPELFLIALASLQLLSDAATGVPVILIVDDAHWLDRPSMEVLSFVARRLEADRILMLVAIRDNYESPLDDARLPEIHLTGLNNEAAEALLDSRNPGLSPAVRARLIEESEGNPLALVELPMALKADYAEAPLPANLPLTTRLERTFLARAEDLPQESRTLLLVAALHDSGVINEVDAASSAISGVGSELAISQAVETGLIYVENDQVLFRHPLVRSAIIQASSFARRSEAHGALAAVLQDQPDRRAWHGASAATGIDEVTASDLDAVASRARGRGDMLVASQALERAAALSAPAAALNRLVQAAEILSELGLPEQSGRLLKQAESLANSPLDQLRLVRLNELMIEGVSDDRDRSARLLTLAESASDEPAIALSLLYSAARQTWWTVPADEERARVIATLDRLPIDEGDPRAIMIRALSDPMGQSATVTRHLSREPGAFALDPGTKRILGMSAFLVSDMERASLFLREAVDGLRRQSRVLRLAPALAYQAWTELFLGNFISGASTAADESFRLARETRQQLWIDTARSAQAMLAAIRGDPDGAEQIIGEVEADLLATRESSVRYLVPVVRGVASISAGRYASGFEHLRRAFDPADPSYRGPERWLGVGYLAEAAAHSSNVEEARIFVARLADDAAKMVPSGIQILLRYANSVLADDDVAESLYTKALEANLLNWPFERARLLLAYGEWLRRQRRVSESRTPLRVARDTFDALGAVPWGERARHELTAAGETSRKRLPGAWDRLSPQELQIAQMAAQGLSNREIGQQLYLSHRTVGSHLYRIFPKLGVTSRAQLHEALASTPA